MDNLKIGDKVLYRKKELAIIVKDLGTNWLNEYEFEIQFVHTGARKIAKAKVLELVAYGLPMTRGKTSDGCICGAWATSYPNIHSEWCPKGKK